MENVLFLLGAKKKHMKTLSLTPLPKKYIFGCLSLSLISGGRRHKSGKGQIRWVSGSGTRNQPGLMEVQVKIYFNYFIVILGEFKQSVVSVEVQP